MQKFKVLRRHDGDREYHEGDIREARAADVAHLVPGVLFPLGDGAEAKSGEVGAADAPKAKKKAAPKKAAGQ